MAPTTEPRSIGPDVAIAIGATVAFVLLYVLSERTAPGQRFDELAHQGRKLTDLEVRRADVVLMRVVTATIVPLLIVGSLLRLITARAWRRLAVTAGSAALALSAAVLLKARLPRPFLIDEPFLNHANTFPSGHITLATTCAFVAVVAAPPSSLRLVRRSASIALVIFTMWLSGSGWHRPSDIAGGLLLTAAVFAAGRLVGSQRPSAPPTATTAPPSTPRFSPRTLRYLSIAGTLGGLALVVTFSIPMQSAPVGVESSLAAYLLCAAANVLLAVGLIGVSARADRS
jgi:hypothetical protein